MDEPETIEPDYLEIKKEHEIKIDDNKIRIEINNNEIIFTLIIDLSFNKYIKRFNLYDFRKKFRISEEKDINELYNDIINYEYEINEKEKKNNWYGREIKLNEEIRLTSEEMIKELIFEIKKIKKEKIELEKQVYELDNIVNKDKYKTEINLTYNTKEEGESKIFGDKFVKINQNNIELNINGYKSKLVSKYKLNKGYNNIKMIIKNKIKDLRYMFDSCKNLENINELKYLNVKYCTNFKGMFNYCLSLKDISPLENWDVSNSTNFSEMFSGCSLLKNIKPLEKWNVLNSTNFKGMFYDCESLNDITPLENWDVSNCTNFSAMFWSCLSLKDIKPLEKWNVTNCNNFSYMFRGCRALKDIKPLGKWNAINCNNFSGMFSLCISLKDNKILEKWNLTKENNFKDAFDNLSI